MTDDEHKRVLAAGVEFYTGLKELLVKYNLDEGHAPSLVLMAMGAVLSTTNMTPGDLADAGKMCARYWSIDQGSTLPLKALFEDPAEGGGMN